MTLRLGLLGDLHLVDEPAAASAAWHNAYDFAGVPARVDEALVRFDAAEVDAVVLLGDLCHHGSPAALRVLGRRLAQVRVPVLAVAGNHDAGGRAALHEAFGGRVTLAEPAGTRIGGMIVAGIHVAPGGWAAAQLDAPPDLHRWPDEPVVLLSHFPLVSHALRLAERGLPYPGDVIGRSAVAAALETRRQPTVVLSGHIHARDASAAGPVLQLTQGALVEPPYEWSVVEVDTEAGCAVSVRRTAVAGVGPAAGRGLPVLIAPQTEQHFAGGRWSASRPAVAA